VIDPPADSVAGDDESSVNFREPKASLALYLWRTSENNPSTHFGE
jgi:hypothetical protein